MKNVIDRRKFFKEVLNWSLTLNILKLNTSKSLSGILSFPGDKKSKVIIIRNNKFKNYNKKLFFDMLKSASIDWQKLFNKDDIIGIKVNALAGINLSPHPELIDAIVENLKLVGVQENKIIVWDRTTRELKQAGFKINENNSAVKCFGTDSNLAGYSDEITISGNIGSCFSRIVTDLCTALINVPVLKDHDLAGTSLSMKNYYGAIHNPNKYHDNNCSPYVADICAVDVLKKKTKLVICDATLSQFHGGPGYKPQWTWEYNGIIISADMTALDSVGTDIIEKKRKEEKMLSLKDEKRFPAYLDIAADRDHNIGVCDLNKIEIIEKII